MLIQSEVATLLTGSHTESRESERGDEERGRGRQRLAALASGELKRKQEEEEEEAEGKKEDDDLSAGRRRYSIYATYSATAIDNPLENSVKPLQSARARVRFVGLYNIYNAFSYSPDRIPIES